jgi:exodeoxyribonuclease V alpha subunit
VKRGAIFDLPPLSPLGTAGARLAGGADPGDPFDGPGSERLLAELRDADLGPESLFLAWQIAAWAEALSPAERRALTALLARALIGVAAGSTRTEVDAAARALMARAPEVVGSPGARRPFILDGRHLYQQRLLACEERLAALLRARRAAPPLLDGAAADEVLRAIADGAGPRATAEQVGAVRAALTGRLTVVSGGPGTGKTTIVLAILRALVRLGLPVDALALAAPTGKAAHRLEEAVKQGLAALASAGGLAPADQRLAQHGPSAQTLHRLLGFSPKSGTFQHHQNNRLAQQLVVIDESSMIDLELMERLARAVPDDARLILLGDADQLPSVEAGAVFRDLTPLAVRLTHSHRVDAGAAAGRRLLELAAAVREGATTGELAARIVERPSAAELRFDGPELLPADQLSGLLDRWQAERSAALPDGAELARHVYALEEGRFSAEDQARLDRLHAHLHGARLLCVTRGRPTGTLAINHILNRRHGSAEAPLIAGEPVMVLRNDYERRLYNGDQGLVVRVEEDHDRRPRLHAAFPARGGWTAWPLDSLAGALELSFAMTVHKAQGSELDRVALLLPEAPIPLLSRELLYTAITRARRAVVICGSPAVLAAGAATRLERSSGLGERLRLDRTG